MDKDDGVAEVGDRWHKPDNTEELEVLAAVCLDWPSELRIVRAKRNYDDGKSVVEAACPTIYPVTG